MRDFVKALRALADDDRVLTHEPMSRHTTFKVGGPADVCFLPASEEEVHRAMDLAAAMNVPCIVMGNGSNLVVRDGGVRGLVIILGEQFSDITVNGNCVFAQAGASLSRLSSAAMENSLSGLEFASGIPGTVGGGAAMNAGAYGGQLSDVLVSARVLKNGAVSVYGLSDMEMGYRTTRPLREGSIILSVKFELAPGNRTEISEKMRGLNARRREKQPLSQPSAGSTFKRPEGHFAGALIEGANLKGARVGGAMVSPKHAGFIVNDGGATAADILALIELVRERVMAVSGVYLETEVRAVGED